MIINSLKNLYKGTPQNKPAAQGIIYKPPPMNQNFMSTLEEDNEMKASKRPLKTSIGMATTTLTSLFDQSLPLSGKLLMPTQATSAAGGGGGSSSLQNTMNL